MGKNIILVADDEKEIAELIRDFLVDEQYDVIVAYDGKKALDLFREFEPTLAILDIMMPQIDGFEVCRIIRSESDIPLIMLSAKKAEVDKVLGLGLGADDYITKPFSPFEVVARVKAQLRRFNMGASRQEKSNRLEYGKLQIDLKSYEVFINNDLLPMTTKEFELLRFLALHPNQVLSREQIYDNVWQTGYGDLNTVTIHIKKLREKIEQDSLNPKYIKTIRGIGYKFCEVNE